MWVYQYEISGGGKFIKTKSRLEWPGAGVGCWGGRGADIGDLLLNMYRVSVWGDENNLEIQWGSLHNAANLINATELNSKFYVVCILPQCKKTFFTWFLRVTLKNLVLSQVQNLSNFMSINPQSPKEKKDLLKLIRINLCCMKPIQTHISSSSWLHIPDNQFKSYLLCVCWEWEDGVIV